MRNFLAFDIGGTLLKYGVLTEDGVISEKFECPTDAHLGGPYIIRRVKELGQQLIRDHDIKGICISTAGQVDSEKGKILYASQLIPNYTGIQLKKELENFFDLPVEVENDVNCAGLAESWIGTGKDVKSLFCLTVGTGIGGSYILDKKLHTGHKFSGGEIGYIPIEGNQFEDLASTKSLILNVAKQKEITEHDIDGKDVFELAKSGDDVCVEQIARQVYYLSKGIATIAYMMNPEMIVIGGGITAQKEYLYPLLMQQLKVDMIETVLNNTKVEIAENLNNAGMIGALRNFLLQESNQPLKNITSVIESNKHKLTKGEQLIANYVTHNLTFVPNTTISQLGNKINVSEATITRFCKKLKFGSYNQFRLMAKEALVSTRMYEYTDKTSITMTNNNYIELLKKFEGLLNVNNIVTLKHAIEKADYIYLYGPNDMEEVVNSLKYKFLNKGIRADVFSNHYQMNISTKIINDSSLVIGISPSGYSEDIVEVLKKAKASGAKTISVTSQQDSPLSETTDLRLLIPLNDNIHKELMNMNEVAVFYLFDIIFKELEQ